MDRPGTGAEQLNCKTAYSSYTTQLSSISTVTSVQLGMKLIQTVNLSEQQWKSSAQIAGCRKFLLPQRETLLISIQDSLSSVVKAACSPSAHGTMNGAALAPLTQGGTGYKAVKEHGPG